MNIVVSSSYQNSVLGLALVTSIHALRKMPMDKHTKPHPGICAKSDELWSSRVLSPLATALWTGQIANCCACVSVCIFF